MTHILIFDGAPASGQQALAAHGAPTNREMFEQALRLQDPDVRCLPLNVADGESLPPGIAVGDFDGVVITGSPLNIYDLVPPVLRQIEAARTVFATGVPVWGSCWGLQLAVAALGGTVRRNPAGRELGVARAITVTEAARGHALFGGKPQSFDALCSHVDEVETLPPGAAVLAGNRVSAVQALEIATPAGAFMGVQYHPEHTFAVSAAIVVQRAARLVEEGLGRSEADLAALAADYRALDADPTRRDLTWRYGLGPEVLDPMLRSAEIGNWLREKVRSGVVRRAAAA